MTGEMQSRTSGALVTLIGLILILLGIGSIVSNAMSLFEGVTGWPRLQLPMPQMTPISHYRHVIGIVGSSLRFLFACASLVSGIGLIRRTSWAWRISSLTLLGLIGYLVLFGLAQRLPFLLQTVSIDTLAQTFWNSLLGLYHTAVAPLKYAILWLFLTSPSVREIWSETIPQRLTHITQRIQGWLPATLSPVAILIGLWLISEALPFLPQLGSLFRNTNYTHTQNEVFAQLAFKLGLILPIIMLFAGVGLLKQIVGMRTFAVVILFTRCALLPLAIIMSITIFSHDSILTHSAYNVLYITGIFTQLVSITVSAAMASFLIKDYRMSRNVNNVA